MKNASKTNVFFNKQKRFLFLLDYDGTLTDFKKNPDQSLLSSATRKVLETLRLKHPVILITGRNLDRLYQVSGLESFPAVGTHGFESRHLPPGIQFAPLFLRRKYKKEATAIWEKVKDLHKLYPGIHIEKKPFSSTLHYRGTQFSLRETKRLIKSFIALSRKGITPDLWTVQKGKKMIEVMPRGFSKGKAVKRLMEYYRGYQPLYAGDDTADIPALRAVKRKGLAIAIGPRIPAVHYDLHFDSPTRFIAWLKKV